MSNKKSNKIVPKPNLATPEIAVIIEEEIIRARKPKKIQKMSILERAVSITKMLQKEKKASNK